jgi:hypothetical protein
MKLITRWVRVIRAGTFGTGDGRSAA